MGGNVIGMQNKYMITISHLIHRLEAIEAMRLRNAFGDEQ